MSNYILTQAEEPPAFKKFLNLGTLEDLPPWSSAPTGSPDEQYAAFRAIGIEGLQGGDPALCRKHGLFYAGGGRINTPEESLPDAQKQVAEGALAATYHVGWGMENDERMDELLQSIVEASTSTGLPMFVETHRATVFQDQYRTVNAIARNPNIMINGDFSHWYTGQEMVYGDWDQKLAFIQPVFERVGFMHGRIGSPGHIQVAVEGTEPYVEHFRDFWTRSMRGFLQHASVGAILPFAPELLQPAIYYASEFVVDGQRQEESDRWQQVLLYLQIAEDCWQNAMAEVS